MIAAVHAYRIVVGVIEKEPHCFWITPFIVPRYERDFGEEVVLLHFLEEIYVVKTAILESEKWIIYDKAG
jgi:hypothetical protein